MTIIEDDADAKGAEAPRRPRWFTPALVGVAIGGAIGAVLLPSTSPTSTPTLEPSARSRASAREAVLTLADVPSGSRIEEEGDANLFDGVLLRRQYVDGWHRAFTRSDAAGPSSFWSDSMTNETADAAEQAILQTVHTRTGAGYIQIPFG